MPYADPEKRKAHRREYYERTKAQAQQYYLENKTRFQETNQRLRERNRKMVNELKSKMGCSRCGWNEDPCGLDFHHTNPKTKKNTVAKLSAFSYGTETLNEEINKCVLLCANCHRVTHKRGDMA